MTLRYNPTPLRIEVRAGYADAYADHWNAASAWDKWFAEEEAQIRADERTKIAAAIEEAADRCNRGANWCAGLQQAAHIAERAS